MRALVTGASGFVGGHLIEHFRASGDDVIGDPPTGLVDICDSGAVAAWLAAERPDVVYHLAGWSDVGASWHEPEQVFRVNAERYPGSANVWDSLGEAYLKAGDRGQALASYRKALELNPHNEQAAKVLRELSAP